MRSVVSATSRADLIRAYLSGADLNRAHFHDANLTGADLTSAKAAGVDLTHARWPADVKAPDGWQRDTNSGRLEARRR